MRQRRGKQRRHETKPFCSNRFSSRGQSKGSIKFLQDGPEFKHGGAAFPPAGDAVSGCVIPDAQLRHSKPS